LSINLQSKEKSVTLQQGKVCTHLCAYHRNTGMQAQAAADLEV